MGDKPNIAIRTLTGATSSDIPEKIFAKKTGELLFLFYRKRKHKEDIRATDI